uniref:Uncharacterized protein n=1 Tax=Anguilla anguilla TaxID=7936 RepID=A0A0E9PRQ3_ANGAN
MPGDTTLVVRLFSFLLFVSPQVQLHLYQRHIIASFVSGYLA